MDKYCAAKTTTKKIKLHFSFHRPKKFGSIYYNRRERERNRDREREIVKEREYLHSSCVCVSLLVRKKEREHVRLDVCGYQRGECEYN